MRSWLRQHGHALREAWRTLHRPRGGLILNALVMALVLALPFGGFTLLENLRPVADKLSVEPEISVFLAPATARAKSSALIAPIRQAMSESGVAGKVDFVPREKALASLGSSNGLASAVATLGNNPLPDAYVLRLAAFQNVDEAQKLDKLTAALRALPNVDHVQVDSDWAKRLAAILHVAQLALLFLAVVLGMVAMAVVFNTVRLQVLNQREAIEVCKLVGATDAFVSRPYYYAGSALGLVAGLLALGLVALALQPMNQALSDVARQYGSSFHLEFLGLPQAAGLLGLSALLGFFGAFVSLQRSLGQLRP